jgi:hypothetical protein
VLLLLNGNVLILLDVLQIGRHLALRRCIHVKEVHENDAKNGN